MTMKRLWTAISSRQTNRLNIYELRTNYRPRKETETPPFGFPFSNITCRTKKQHDLWVAASSFPEGGNKLCQLKL